jgi:outer membrane protein OmpA-like peptidoglycan-associated protein
MFEQLIAEAASRLNLSAASVSALVRGLLGMMTNEQTGGLEGFMAMFRRAGLGDEVTSWFGGREGRTLTPNQVESALGTSALGNLAASTGLTRSAVSTAAAFVLPKLIGLLTPGGILPSTNSLLSQVSNYIDRPGGVSPPRVERRGWPGWLPWAAAAVALLALVSWLSMRGPVGTIDPQLTVSNRDGKVTYSGVVRDESTRSAIVTALQSTFGQANVDGTLRVDPNVRPATWLPRLGGLLATANAPGVDLALNGDAVNVGGWISAAQRQSVTEKLRGVVGATSTIGSLGDAAGDAVRAANDKARAALGAIGTSGVASPTAVVQAMNLAVINFPTGSAQIPAGDMDVIRQSAEALKRATGARIEIGGHTDNTGDAASNMALSQQRADAMKEALVASGVPAAMLTTRGYGDTKPRAPNDTEYGRFQNRRIEYSVVQ